MTTLHYIFNLCFAAEWGKDHGLKASKHWAIERYLAVALIPTVPVAFIYPNPYLEYIMTAGVFLHAHWYVLYLIHSQINWFTLKLPYTYSKLRVIRINVIRIIV